MATLTKGEKGGDPQKRSDEFKQSGQKIGFTPIQFNFPDLELDLVDTRVLYLAVLELVRQVAPQLVLSFYPHELTNYFDHPDHNRAGQAVSWAVAASDVPTMATQSLPVKQRPASMFWTTNPSQTDVVLATGQQHVEQVLFLAQEVYSSQSIPLPVLMSLLGEKENYRFVPRTANK